VKKEFSLRKKKFLCEKKNFSTKKEISLMTLLGFHRFPISPGYFH